MGARPRKTQPKSTHINLAVTVEEREAVEGIAAARNLKHFSTLLREHSLNEIVDQWRRLRARLERSGNFRPASDDARLRPAA